MKTITTLMILVAFAIIGCGFFLFSNTNQSPIGVIIMIAGGIVFGLALLNMVFAKKINQSALEAAVEAKLDEAARSACPEAAALKQQAEELGAAASQMALIAAGAQAVAAKEKQAASDAKAELATEVEQNELVVNKLNDKHTAELAARDLRISNAAKALAALAEG
jgi:uncharacterized membrane protein YeiB